MSGGQRCVSGGQRCASVGRRVAGARRGVVRRASCGDVRVAVGRYRDGPAHSIRCTFDGTLKELITYLKPRHPKKIYYQKVPPSAAAVSCRSLGAYRLRGVGRVARLSWLMRPLPPPPGCVSSRVGRTHSKQIFFSAIVHSDLPVQGSNFNCIKCQSYRGCVIFLILIITFCYAGFI